MTYDQMQVNIASLNRLADIAYGFECDGFSKSAAYAMAERQYPKLAAKAKIAQKAGLLPPEEEDDDLQNASDTILDPDDDDDNDSDEDELEAGNEDTRNEKMKTKSEIEIARLAAERQQKTGRTYAESYQAVLTSNPQLYAAYRKEHRAMIAKAEAGA